MKSTIKIFWIIAFVAIIAFAFVACDDGDNDLCVDGHTWGEWTEVKAPTADEPGSEERKCTVCGAHYTNSPREIPPTGTKDPCEAGHSFTEWDITTPAQILVEGLRTEKCSVCGALGSVTEVIPALPTHTVANISEWDDAMNDIAEGGNDKSWIIQLAADIPVGNEIIDFWDIEDLNITIRGNHKLTATNNNQLIYVYEKQEVILQDVDLIGLPSNSSILVYIDDGSLIMRGSASISGNTRTQFSGAGVFIDGGTLIMEDNSRIFGNTANANGGGVFVDGGGSFHLISGTVYGNTETDTTLRNNHGSSGSGASLFVDNGTATFGTAETPFTLVGGNHRNDTLTGAGPETAP